MTIQVFTSLCTYIRYDVWPNFDMNTQKKVTVFFFNRRHQSGLHEINPQSTRHEEHQGRDILE